MMLRTCLAPLSLLLVWTAAAAELTPADRFTNSLGLVLVRVEPGTYLRGSSAGEFDERPVHAVTLSQPFYLAATEVSNAQFEQFAPAHRALRGQRGLSLADDEAVIFVSWPEAVAFCDWLTEKEGRPYRLPTEAEWEYACRAGTTTAYATGDALPKEFLRSQKFNWFPQPVSLRVGQTPANAWGLHDLHGNVEEWCLDWYAPYAAGPQRDPLGAATGEFRVTRGGSHNTQTSFLRSANRSAALPADRHWLIGFRVVQAGPPAGTFTTPAPPPLWAQGVASARFTWPAPVAEPFFRAPQRFVHLPPDADGPLYAKHNHCPALTWCDNGDLLAVWFSTKDEGGREMTIAASRLRAGQAAWEPASEFFKVPDRNMTGSALLNDGQGTLWHFNGIEAGEGWANLAVAARTSTDHGATWSPARLIAPEHQPRNQVIAGTLRTREGWLVQACDAVHGGNGGTAIHVSRDSGQTWTDPGAGTPKPQFVNGGRGGTIAGIHAGVAQLADGHLLAFGRGDTIAGHMPRSVSRDFGQSWEYAPSPWPAIGSGQRLVLTRLREGPLLFCSFTDASDRLKNPRGLTFATADGGEFTGYGLFAALSFDDGETWPVRRLLTDGAPARQLSGGAWTGEFTLDPTHAEPRGYLACTQTPDGTIQLVSSAQHYQFNLAWMQAKPTRP